MLKIKKLLHISNQSSFSEIINALSESEWIKLSHTNWEEFPYKPDVSLRIGHDGLNIFLCFRVSEKSIRAKYARDFEDVWKDSCVEFFISPEKNEYYYNYEFNCIGSAILCYGQGREKREPASLEIMQSIKRYSSLGYKPIDSLKGQFNWELLLVIPGKTLFREAIKSFSGLGMKANFYKCGDELPLPHFLSWSEVKTKSPDFHRPEFFGDIFFE
jgi:hypothetical protein